MNRTLLIIALAIIGVAIIAAALWAGSDPRWRLREERLKLLADIAVASEQLNAQR